MRIGFIGLGNVGGKLAGSLIRNNFKLTVFDLDEEIMNDFKSKDQNNSNKKENLKLKLEECTKMLEDIKSKV